MDGTLGKLAAIGMAARMHNSFPVEWLVKAHLDLPMKIDVKATQEIIISE
jgi:hypothetical protein